MMQQIDTAHDTDLSAARHVTPTTGNDVADISHFAAYTGYENLNRWLELLMTMMVMMILVNIWPVAFVSPAGKS